MGTFTLSYTLRNVFIKHKDQWIIFAMCCYFGSCYERQCYHKASMMKGHSKMFEHVSSAIPRNIDPWKY
ncbi:Hypothetical protein SRAE_1000156900 [Strongyloides ratti]|uniref:Uncharacterized protein n=1 Tax=Strongyloides ratti TaxID=34506 RepID=A0A090L0V5_STRRB|nr:Hypothetical protein SRAE_1000156900 [Strongyloides ratti]CEF63306.1 Hypothetical protein SRAE_1000156900 [Strongyloides ratti]